MSKLLCRADNSQSEIPDDVDLDYAQQTVAHGGNIELAENPHEGVQIICDENGLYNTPYAKNAIASCLCGRPIVGDVIILTGEDQWE